MRNRRLAPITAIAVLILAACTSNPPAASESAPESAGASQAPAASGSQAATGDCTVAVSWNNFQQPRWAAKDKPNIQETVEAGGGTYIDADANLDTVQQLTDVETLIGQGADVLILLAQDTAGVGPALETAANAGVPVIAYDRLIEDPSVLYITFDNVGVGKAEAEAMFEAVPEGNYVLIKGDPGDPNASTFLPSGWDEAGLQDKIDSGEITIVDDQFTDAWDTQTAQNNMEAIIDSANADGTQIDAVLAENDSTALGVVAALQAKGYDPIPVSGQDGDTANLQNVAKGLQYVDVWKDANELGKVAGAAALQLCEGTEMADLTIPDGLINDDVAPTAGMAAADFTTPGPDGEPDSGDENTVTSFILQPQPITADNLDLILDSGWLTKDVLCEGVEADSAPPACQ
ncbi:MAG TPA: substrate-binding domain-containing protein [Candidatus Limnocylindria bacterium]|jgi:D-xylose transport system substrate-binding protein|nr:substrate-binding domain-containing protein [Candidatus Limnocylindria bacterium]